MSLCPLNPDTAPSAPAGSLTRAMDLEALALDLEVSGLENTGRAQNYRDAAREIRALVAVIASRDKRIGELANEVSVVRAAASELATINRELIEVRNNQRESIKTLRTERDDYRDGLRTWQTACESARRDANELRAILAQCYMNAEGILTAADRGLKK